MAILAGEKADCVPAGFWYHFPGHWDAKTTAEAHLKCWKETDADIIKVMQDYGEYIEHEILTPDDYKHIKFQGKESRYYQKLVDVLKRIQDGTKGEVYTIQTLFSPLKAITRNIGYPLLMEHIKSCPEQLDIGLKTITEGLCEWAAGFVEEGADGLFYSAQFSEPGRFTKPEWERFCKKWDIQVLNAAESKGGKNMVHICGEPNYEYASMPEWYTDYPYAIINWSVKDTGLTMPAGKKFFKKPVCGGMHNKASILDGTDEAIALEAGRIIKGMDDACGLEGFMLGADCTVQGEGISNKKLRVAVDAAHQYVSR